MPAHVFSAEDLRTADHHGIQCQEEGIDRGIQTDGAHGIGAHKIGREQGGYDAVDGSHHCQQYLDRQKPEAQALNHFEIGRKLFHGGSRS